MNKEQPTGIRKTVTGYQTYVWVVDPTHKNGGYQASKRWKSDATLSEMKQWRMKRKLRLPEVLESAAATFADDVADYVQRDKVLRMPTAAERIRHMREWVSVFGARDRRTIKPNDIQRALEDMRGHLGPASVNKRRTALMDLWTTLDGRHEANPVKGTRPYDEPHPEPRAPELATVLRIIRAMPTKTAYARQCKARLQVITWTGWPHAIIKTLQPSDLPYWKEGRAFITRRKKGKGSRARWLPLLPEAKRALREFHKTQAYGPFSNSSLHKRVSAVCRKLKIPRVRVYDFRHFFLTLIAVITRDERAVMELGLISSPEIARRYTEAATDPRVQAAVKHVAGKLPKLKLEAAKTRRTTKRRRPSKPRQGRNPATTLPDTHDTKKH